MIVEPGCCYCSCHQPGSMESHCFPCCDGKCLRCGQYIERGGMEKHQAEHDERIKKAIEELTEGKG